MSSKHLLLFLLRWSSALDQSRAWVPGLFIDWMCLSCTSCPYFRYSICKHNLVIQKIPINCSILNYHKALYIYWRGYMQQGQLITSKRKITEGPSAEISVLKVTISIQWVLFLFPLIITCSDKKKCLLLLHQFCQLEASTQYLASELLKFG